jgi:hypothetical protein
LTVNAGFFDPKNSKTISYVVTDRLISADPMFNSALLSNPFFRKNMAKIINRSEFRIMQCGNKFEYAIVGHKAEVPFGCVIQTSAQGGPLLLPVMRMEEEFFVVRNEEGKVIRESASVLHKTARTLIGIKNLANGKQEVHIFVVTNAHPMTLEEARDLGKSYDLDSMMAFDGGSSTSLDYKNIHVTSTQDNGDTGRALKSFMIIQK